MAEYKVISYNKIPSTQTQAHVLIKQAKVSDKTVIVANSQFAGRGRFRRRWVSPRGNLYASFVYRCAAQDARISYAVAVAVAETVLSFGAPARIKWPNDILVNGAKMCGVLIEYVGDFVIVGIGINMHSAPRVTAYTTTRLADYATVSRAEVMGRLIRNLDAWRECDFARVRARWTELAVGIGARVIWRRREYKLYGIDMDGALVLQGADGADVRVHGDEITITDDV